MWSWHTNNYKKEEEPIDDWKKRRADGRIWRQKKIGGILFPMAYFGVGGEFGVGGKFDNNGRFDFWLPYADQGYVDDDADVMSKMGKFFSGSKKGKKDAAKGSKKAPEPADMAPKKKKFF